MRDSVRAIRSCVLYPDHNNLHLRQLAENMAKQEVSRAPTTMDRSMLLVLMESFRPSQRSFQVIRPYKRAITRAPVTPRAAASVGVAIPK